LVNALVAKDLRVKGRFEAMENFSLGLEDLSEHLVPDRQEGRWMDHWMDRWMDRWMDHWEGRWMDHWMDRPEDRWMDLLEKVDSGEGVMIVHFDCF
jgi:hypothetical protein